MNILVVSEFGLYGELSCSFVHSQTREYVAQGHRVRVIIPNGVGKEGRNGGRFERPLLLSQIDGVELYDIRYVTLSKYGMKYFNTNSAIAAIRLQWNRIFEDFKPDVIHAHTLGFDSKIGAWIKTKLGCPLVVTTHGSDTNVPLERGQADLLKTCCDQADAVVAVSNQLKERLKTCGTKTPISAIYNGFVQHLRPADAVRNPYAMIQVGNLIPSKRVDVTIRAFAKLREKWPEMTLTVVGQGPRQTSLEELCQQLGISGSVRFLGQLPNREVFSRLCESTFFVMASKPEGFGIVYLEAMAAGCITIGTEGQGIADIIDHGTNGFLVPADEPERIAELIDQCLRKPEAAALIAAEGQKCASALTWERNVQGYLQIFEEFR